MLLPDVWTSLTVTAYTLGLPWLRVSTANLGPAPAFGLRPGDIPAIALLIPSVSAGPLSMQKVNAAQVFTLHLQALTTAAAFLPGVIAAWRQRFTGGPRAWPSFVPEWLLILPSTPVVLCSLAAMADSANLDGASTPKRRTATTPGAASEPAANTCSATRTHSEGRP
jgi:hypothetical protein